MHYKYDFFKDTKIARTRSHYSYFLQLFLHVIHTYSVYAGTVNVLRSIFPVFVLFIIRKFKSERLVRY